MDPRRRRNLLAVGFVLVGIPLGLWDLHTGDRRHGVLILIGVVAMTGGLTYNAIAASRREQTNDE